VDTVERRVVLPPFGGRNVFFRMRGTLKPGRTRFPRSCACQRPRRDRDAGRGERLRRTDVSGGHDSARVSARADQVFFRWRTSVWKRWTFACRRACASLREGTDDIPTSLGQLQINVQTLDPSLLSVVDLSVFNTVLIGVDAARGDALCRRRRVASRLHAPGRDGGRASQGLTWRNPGLLPFPVAFDTLPRNITNPEAEAHVINPRSTLLFLAECDHGEGFQRLGGERARNVPIGIDTRYGTVITIGDPETGTPATVLTARIGRGILVYTSLALDTQLAAVHPGAARLLVNMMTAGMAPTKR
jgi:hypothetical protein